MSMHKIGLRHHDSAEKLFGYVGLFVKEPLKIVFNDVIDKSYEIVYEPMKNIIISQTLFQTDSCHSSGKCCKVAFDLAYTREGYLRVVSAAEKNANAKRLLENLKKIPATSNGKEFGLWVHFNDKEARYTGLKTCDFLEHPDSGEFKDKFICGVHGGYTRVFDSAQPAHCIFPHFICRKRSDYTSFVGRMQFGRNWRFGCPVVFNRGIEYFDKDYQQDIDKLKIMQLMASDLNVETWIPEMVDWMMNNKDEIEHMITTGEYHSIVIHQSGVIEEISADMFGEENDVEV